MMGWTRGPRPFDWRKTLGLPMANLISTCAYLEHELTDLLITMTGPHSPVAIAMHGELSSTVAQIAAMRGAAKALLEERELELFEIVIGIAQDAIKERNTVAHALWVHDDEWPDAMILLGSEEYFGRQISGAAKNWKPKIRPGMKPLGHNAQRMFIYRERDFDEITSRLLSALTLTKHLNYLVGAEAEAKDDIYAQLSGVPAVAVALAHRRKHQKNKPAGQPERRQRPDGKKK